MAKRPQQIVRPKLSYNALRALAKRAVYVGSKEHKTVQWWGGLPGIRVDKKTGKPLGRPHRQKTTICPLVNQPNDKRRATAWIRVAIRSGRCRFVEGDKDFPKYVWYRVAGQAWYGFCINSVAGEYKGWPLEVDDPDAVFD